MARFLPFLIWFVLALYASIDCARTPADRMPGRLNKVAWLAIIVLVPLMGAISWLVVKGAQRAEDAERGYRPPATGPARPGGGRGQSQRRPRGPVAPDDDPDFLSRLEQEARARRRQERQRERDLERREREERLRHGGTQDPSARPERGGEDTGAGTGAGDLPPDDLPPTTLPGDRG